MKLARVVLGVQETTTQLKPKVLLATWLILDLIIEEVEVYGPAATLR